MSVSVFAYSKKGMETAKRIAAALDGGVSAFAPARIAGEGFSPIPSPSAALYEERFKTDDALIFVSSCGVAVRCTAPYIRSKAEDPAVIAADECGKWIVPLLSGHIGGANALAERIASAVGSTAVVTTATDVNGRFSVDAWAASRGYAITDLKAAKRFSAAILERDLPFFSDLPVSGTLPNGIFSGTSGDIGAALTFRKAEPFTDTLRIVPKCLNIGVGCRRGTAKEAVAEAIETVLSENGLDTAAIGGVFSIDIKSGEAGLLGYCAEAGIPISFHSAEELASVKGDFASSDFVRSVTGVDNVCERAAMLRSRKLLVGKTARGGVTVAVGLSDTEVGFE